MSNPLTLKENNRSTQVWAIFLVASLLLTVGFLARHAWQDRVRLTLLAGAIARRQHILARRPVIDQRLAALRRTLQKAHTLGVTVPMTSLAVSMVQTQIATLIAGQAGTLSMINTLATDSAGLRLAHVTLTAVMPLARLQPLLNALAGFPWAVRVTHLTIHHIHKGTAEIQLGLTVPIFRTTT